MDAAFLLSLPNSAPAGIVSMMSILQVLERNHGDIGGLGVSTLSEREAKEVLSRRLDFN